MVLAVIGSCPLRAQDALSSLDMAVLSVIWQRQFTSLVATAAAAAFQGSKTTGLGISRYRKHHDSLLELKVRKTETSKSPGHQLKGLVHKVQRSLGIILGRMSIS